MRAASANGSGERKRDRIEDLFPAIAVQVARSVSAPRLLPVASPSRSRAIENFGRRSNTDQVLVPRAISCSSLRCSGQGEQDLAPTLHERIASSGSLGSCNSPVVRRSLSSRSAVRSAVAPVCSDVSSRAAPPKWCGTQARAMRKSRRARLLGMRAASANGSGERKRDRIEDLFPAIAVQVARSVSAPRLLPVASPSRSRAIENFGRRSNTDQVLVPRAISCSSLRCSGQGEQDLAPTLHERIASSGSLGSCNSPVVRRSLSSRSAVRSAVAPVCSDVSSRAAPPKWCGCAEGFYEESGLVDLENAVAAQVSGPAAVEGLLWQNWPLFIAWECAAVFLTWLVCPYLAGEKRGVGSGLESLWPGQTGFVLQYDCNDARLQLWRWVSYQFTHADWMHMLGNVSMALVAGVPLEGFHGHVRLMVIFNLGVIGGAAFHALLVEHSPILVGMSAGVYALVGMHVAELAMNWTQSRYRYVKLALIVCVGISEIASPYIMGPGRTSHSSHAGGFTLGLLTGVLLVRNLKIKRFERVLQVLVLLTLSSILFFSSSWLTQWPPRSIWQEVEDWCWVRQVNNKTIFHDSSWHCVVCQSANCVAKWSGQLTLNPVDVEECPGFERG
eukprot:TRINITY_DN22680_c0_g3_i1.p1 TRINITY_DN22680_c0_g3~~TRINITY_DN22680_c0_g3_i1.p1  ORF type:complete len:615 (+),score=58.16 TRINITY_DN22680_c0_g3_i1:45-1889(+)